MKANTALCYVMENSKHFLYLISQKLWGLKSYHEQTKKPNQEKDKDAGQNGKTSKVIIYKDPNGDYYSSLNTSPSARGSKESVLKWLKEFFSEKL